MAKKVSELYAEEIKRLKGKLIEAATYALAEKGVSGSYCNPNNYFTAFPYNGPGEKEQQVWVDEPVDTCGGTQPCLVTSIEYIENEGLIVHCTDNNVGQWDILATSMAIESLYKILEYLDNCEPFNKAE